MHRLVAPDTVPRWHRRLAKEVDLPEPDRRALLGVGLVSGLPAGIPPHLGRDPQMGRDPLSPAGLTAQPVVQARGVPRTRSQGGTR